MRNGPYTLIVAPRKYPGMKYRGRYAYEHHVVWWRRHGFVPPKGQQIHHLNGDHTDNRIQNLQLLTSEAHREVHAELNRLKTKYKTFDCPTCLKPKTIKARLYKWRKKNSASGNVYCSRSCQVSFSQRKRWADIRLANAEI